MPLGRVGRNVQRMRRPCDSIPERTLDVSNDGVDAPARTLFVPWVLGQDLVA